MPFGAVGTRLLPGSCQEWWPARLKVLFALGKELLARDGCRTRSLLPPPLKLPPASTMQSGEVVRVLRSMPTRAMGLASSQMGDSKPSGEEAVPRLEGGRGAHTCCCAGAPAPPPVLAKKTLL